MKVYVIECFTKNYGNTWMPVYLEATAPLKKMTQKALKRIVKHSKAMRYCHHRRWLRIRPYNLIAVKGGK